MVFDNDTHLAKSTSQRGRMAIRALTSVIKMHRCRTDDQELWVNQITQSSHCRLKANHT